MSSALQAVQPPAQRIQQRGFPFASGAGWATPIRSGVTATAHPFEAEAEPATGSFPAELADLLGNDGLEEAWARFLERYSRILLAVAFGFGPGYDQAMDRYAFLLDELRRDGYRRLRGFRAGGPARFATWLVVVSRRLCIDHHRACYGRARRTADEASRLVRRRLRETDGGPEDVDALPDSGQIEAGQVLVEAERGEALRRALGGLSATDLRLLELRFQEDRPAREIASILGLPTAFHVYRRLRHVCDGLRAELARAGLDGIGSH